MVSLISFTMEIGCIWHRPRGSRSHRTPEPEHDVEPQCFRVKGLSHTCQKQNWKKPFWKTELFITSGFLLAVEAYCSLLTIYLTMLKEMSATMWLTSWFPGFVLWCVTCSFIYFRTQAWIGPNKILYMAFNYSDLDTTLVYFANNTP